MRKLIFAKLLVKKGGSLKKLSRKGLDLLIDKLEVKITSEDHIDSTIDDLDTGVLSFDDMVELVQKESDRKARSVHTSLEKDYDMIPKNKGAGNDETILLKPGQLRAVDSMISEAVTEAMAPFNALMGNIRAVETRSKLKAAKEQDLARGNKLVKELGSGEAYVLIVVNSMDHTAAAVNPALDLLTVNAIIAKWELEKAVGNFKKTLN